jgi:hypothetical protein
MLGEYVQMLEKQSEEKKSADDRKLSEFRDTKMLGLLKEIEHVTKHNQILTN